MDSASIIFLKNEKNEVLFERRSHSKKDAPNCWALPAGTCLENEGPEECAIREAKEELGVGVEVQRLIKSHSYTRESGKEISIHIFLCKIKSGEPVIKIPEETAELKWETLDNFFRKYKDEEIGKGLQKLRTEYKNLNIDPN